MEYGEQANMEAEEVVDMGDLLKKLDLEGLTNPNEYEKVQEVENQAMKNEYKPVPRKSADFLKRGFTSIENSVDKAKEFARLQNGYYERIKAENNPQYGMLIRAKNNALTYLGREAPPMPSLSELIDMGLGFVDDIKKDLAPARESTLTLAGMMADYKNNRVIKKLAAAGRYRVTVEEKIMHYKELFRQVDGALIHVEVADDAYFPLMVARGNINMYLSRWEEKSGMSRDDALFKGPEVESIEGYELLCWTTLQLCNRFQNNVNNIYEHLLETKPIYDGIGATNKKLGALQSVVYDLASNAMRNVKIIGEATDNIARITLSPEISQKFPDDLSVLVKEFVGRVTGQKMKIEPDLDAAADRILKTKGYFSTRYK